MSLATVASVVGIGAGLNSIFGGGRNTSQGAQNAANNAADRADPFGNYRDQFAQMLVNRFGSLTDNKFDPERITSDPAYQFALKSGTDAVNRGAAASGMFNSGNRLVELEKLGTGLASQFATQQQDRNWNQNMGILGLLGNFSGANINPATAANLQWNGYQAGQQMNNNSWSSIGSGLASLGKSFGSLFGGNSSGTADPNAWSFGLSDIRTKEDITPVGKTDGGLTTYTFRYKGDPQIHMGLMAHEVEEKHPEAVRTREDGFKEVNYGMLATMGA